MCLERRGEGGRWKRERDERGRRRKGEWVEKGDGEGEESGEGTVIHIDLLTRGKPAEERGKVRGG